MKCLDWGWWWRLRCDVVICFHGVPVTDGDNTFHFVPTLPLSVRLSIHCINFSGSLSITIPSTVFFPYQYKWWDPSSEMAMAMAISMYSYLHFHFSIHEYPSRPTKKYDGGPNFYKKYYDGGSDNKLQGLGTHFSKSVFGPSKYLSLIRHGVALLYKPRISHVRKHHICHLQQLHSWILSLMVFGFWREEEKRERGELPDIHVRMMIIMTIIMITIMRMDDCSHLTRKGSGITLGPSPPI